MRQMHRGPDFIENSMVVVESGHIFVRKLPSVVDSCSWIVGRGYFCQTELLGLILDELPQPKCPY